jgi:UDP-glucose:(heptosyl)LPS alpha-1,3-glucosyltransferase
MKIALVKRRYSLRHGGSERYCVNLARRLQKLGHDVTVIGENIDDDLQDDVRFIPVPVNNMTSWTRNRSFAVNCGQEARKGNFDIVYGLGRAYGLDAVRVTERLQSHWVKVYYRHPAHQLVQRLNPRHRTLINLEQTIYRSKEVRRIVTQSQLDRMLIIENYGIPEEKIRTIYNGVDTVQFHPGVRNNSNQVREELGIELDEPLLLFASMDFEGKGLRTIFHAMRNTRHHETRLLVLGNGPIRKFQNIARELGLENRVIFAGRRDDIQHYYGTGDLFILPTAYEPFPNVNLEALACGCPVVTTTTSGSADVIEDVRNGYLISGIDAVEEITEILNHHLDLPLSERNTMSGNCWNTAKEMTVEKNVASTLEMFEEVLLEKFRV